MASTTDSTLARIAGTLVRATEERSPVPPVSEGRDLSIRDAYAIQLHAVELRLAGGARIVGRKVGLTSRAMQEVLGVDEPDFGHLFDDMLLPDGGTLKLADHVAPRAEPETAFRLRADLRGPGVTAEDVREAIEVAFPALEIIDSRIADWRITLVDTVADNASCGAFALGPPIDCRDLDLGALRCRLIVNGETAEEGLGAAVLGHPFNAVAWLANTLAGYDAHLSAGDIVLPGSVTRAVPIAAGDEVCGDFGVLGSVRISVA
ncbi:MAG: 2-keto-4-pentenoate hydratase [Conexibacter sp.]|nr:2-keto-4-pentenoate hydratase [Conexibacter sp.]